MGRGKNLLWSSCARRKPNPRLRFKDESLIPDLQDSGLTPKRGVLLYDECGRR